MDFCIADSQFRFLATVDAGNADSLFFAGDLGQRIFQVPFSWKALGVDIRGWSRTLHINCRTSHQLRAQADLLLGPGLEAAGGRIGFLRRFSGP